MHVFRVENNDGYARNIYAYATEGFHIAIWIGFCLKNETTFDKKKKCSKYSNLARTEVCHVMGYAY